MPPKTAKIKNALKSAARLPVRRRRTVSSSSDSPMPSSPATVTTATGRSRSLKKGLRVGRLSLGNGKGSGRNMQSPIEGESPLVLLRVQVVACTDLLAKDRNGFSDPFATISLPPHPTRHSTPVSKRTLNPLFPAAQSTFDFPIYLSLADRLGVLEIVIWDKDYFGVEKIGMGRKEYLGEVGISLEDWFSMREPGEQVRALGWHEQGNTPFSISLASTRSNTHARGTVQLKIGFVEVPKHQAHHQRFPLAKDAVGTVLEGIEGILGKDERDPDVGVDFEEVYSELLKRSRPSLVNIPPVSGFSLSSCPSSSFVPLRLARNIPSRTKKVNVCKSVKMSICVVLRA
ncbi:C2 domain-containing protein [Lentinula guzmanii]|uniref:C2 domain-containing protein n=1 Tax=Lentinula guzmanii TaxID=2804957 RepID=A0AA38MV52_9AGAR|nr:C2 domain-containing protein [Lentinula guzmanii]